jgi:hypothetical protein
MESAAQPFAVEPLLQLRARDNAASLNGVEHEQDTSGALDPQTELCVLAKRRHSDAKLASSSRPACADASPCRKKAKQS